MYVSAIVLAAGKGTRFKSCISKVLVKIDSQPILIYCLKILNSNPYIRDIIVVASMLNKEAISRLIRQYRITKIKSLVLGGRRRQDSVACGLEALDSRCDMVLIHDGARPFIDDKIVSGVIKEAKVSYAAAVGVPVNATIKEVVSYKVSGVRKTKVKKTLDRSRLWQIQTPQVFKKQLILDAYKRFGDLDVTDDAALVEKTGKKVSLVKGSYLNIKITTPDDLLLAKAIARHYR